MRRVWSLVLVSVFVTVFASMALAEENKSDTQGKGAMQGPMMGMWPMMGAKSMVATSDGGVIVLIGNKLQKYDKDLVLQKEVEIKTDVSCAHKMMENCPMMQGKMQNQPQSAGENKK